MLRRLLLKLLGFPIRVQNGPPSVEYLDIEPIAHDVKWTMHRLNALADAVDRNIDKSTEDLVNAIHEWADMKDFD